MYPIILYDASETAFTTNGLGRLSDAISCKVTEERNGSFECTLEYLSTGEKAAEIKADRIIYTYANKSGTGEAFRIYYVKKDMSGKMTVYAQQVAQQRAKGAAVLPFSTTNKTPAQILMLFNSHNANQADVGAISFSADLTQTTGWTVEAPASLYDQIMAFAAQIDADVEWHLFTCKITHRGENRGAFVRYAKNLTGLDYTEDAGNIFTSVIAFHKSDAGVICSDIADAQTIPTEHPRTKVMDATSQFKDAPDKSLLNIHARAEAMANGADAIPESCQVSAVDDAEKTTVLQIGDTVTVQYPAFNISKEAQINKLTYNVLLGTWDAINVGAKQPTLAENILGPEQERSAAAFDAKDSFIIMHFDNGQAHIFGTVPVTASLTTQQGKMWVSDQIEIDLPVAMSAASVTAQAQPSAFMSDFAISGSVLSFVICKFQSISDTNFTLKFDIWGVE